ncbi:MAG: hypothetical protein MUO26_00170 [Methanotrichaceae archaeon]|nr:hypothetical protein [Methanotrichaceae archaeon]
MDKRISSESKGGLQNPFSPREKDNKWFPLVISIINAFAYAYIVLTVTYVDGHYHNLVYGLRLYPWGYWVCLIAIPVFIITYLITKSTKSPSSKAVIIFLTFILILFILTLTDFNVGDPQVERPNGALVAFLFFSELLICTMVYMQYIEIDLKFIEDSSIPNDAKLERVRFEYSIYSKVLITVIAASLAAFYTMYCNLPRLFETFTNEAEAATLIFTNYVIAMFVFATFIIIFAIQIVVIIYYIANQLTQIKK